MEHLLQVCVCIPEDDSYTVYCSTQWVNGCQFAVASVLGIQDNQYVHTVYVCMINSVLGSTYKQI